MVINCISGCVNLQTFVLLTFCSIWAASFSSKIRKPVSLRSSAAAALLWAGLLDVLRSLPLRAVWVLKQSSWSVAWTMYPGVKWTHKSESLPAVPGVSTSDYSVHSLISEAATRVCFCSVCFREPTSPGSGLQNQNENSGFMRGFHIALPSFTACSYISVMLKPT